MGPVACSVIKGAVRVHSAPKVASDGIARAMQNLPGFSRERVDDAGPEFRFGVVRHPLDRLVSGWAYFCKDGRINHQDQLRQLGYKEGMTFDAFLDVALSTHWMNQHTRKQVDFIGSQPFDRLCRIENLAEEWAALRERFPVLRDIGWQNRSTHGLWKTYYSAEMASRAEQIYADDLNLFETSRNPAKETPMQKNSKPEPVTNGKKGGKGY